MDAGLLGLSVFEVVVITQRPFLFDVNSGPFPLKMFWVFFVQGFSEKVSISYYTLYMRNWRSVSGLKNLWFCTVSTLKCVVA